ncbi:MAG: PAS domain S-box protein [Nitrospiraceae bacterium]|nr:PAS domain S-box protein [Nitrospiraceae bacterium]
MNIHKRLIVMVGLGLLLLLSTTVVSLESIAMLFAQTTRSVSQVSLEVRKVWRVEQKIHDAVRLVHEYVRTGETRFKPGYDAIAAAVNTSLDEIGALHRGERETQLLEALSSDWRAIAQKSDRIFSADLAVGSNRADAAATLTGIDDLLAWIDHDLEQYKEENAARLSAVARDLQATRTRIVVLFGIILVAMIGFLAGFGWYLYRRVSLPLTRLWAGTEEISRGNLDHQIQVRGDSDIVMLAARFNDMGQRLKVSYSDLERRLLERTKQMSALNSVALTLGRRGSLRELLQRSLSTILESFPDLEARGGIFLREPEGDTLRLVAHQGLSPSFVAQEERIKMGECLCGTVAQTGELVFAEEGCDDPRHTRAGESGHMHIVAPIKSRGIVLGVIFLYPTKQFLLQPSDIQLFDTIGAQLGMAVENLRLYGEVKESSVKYWDLFEHSRDILFTMDPAGRITFANRSSEELFGMTKVEMTGRNVLEFLSGEEHDRLAALLQDEGINTQNFYEFTVTPRSGQHFILEAAIRRIDRNGVLTGYQVSARDVTEQRALREKLISAERLCAIGEVGIAVRHEINNPLTTVIGNAELLLDRLEEEDDGELRKRLDLILDNSLRIAEIVKRLQDRKKDRTVEYTKGVRMTDLGKG